MVFSLRRGSPGPGPLVADLGAQLVVGAQLLAEILVEEQAAREASAARLRELDHVAQTTAHQLLGALAESFVTPVDRNDLYRLGWALRTCTDRMDAVADQIVLLRAGALPAGFSELVQQVVRAADVTAAAVPVLTRSEALTDAWTELVRLGKQAGQTHRRLTAELTRDGSDPATMIRTTTVAQALRRVLEAFEDVADALQAVVVREG